MFPSALVFGWPAVAAADLAFSAGFLSTRRWLGVVGATLAAPFCFLTTLYPIAAGRPWGAVALAANFLSASLLCRGRKDIAFAFLLPFMTLVLLFAVLVIGSR